MSIRFVVQNDSGSSARMKVDSFKIKRDTDGDGLSDTVEEGTIRTELGPVHTSKYLADTDGDGLTDGEELGARTSNAYGPIFAVNSFPDATDSDGDGLDDYEETERTRPIYVIDTHQEAVDFLAATKDETANATQYFDVRSVSSDPLRDDTDGDGVDDYEEITLGTDPDDKDTDGDGIVDSHEQSVGDDPTIFDVVPPRIEVPYADTYSPENSLDRKYVVEYSISDPSGVSSAEFHMGEKLGEHPSPSLADEIEGNRSFTIGPIDHFLDEIKGTSLEIRTEDRYGNRGKTVAIARPNVLGRQQMPCEPVVPDSPLFGYQSAYLESQCLGQGIGSGTIFVLGEEVEGIVDLAQDPSILLTAVDGVLKLLQDWGLLEPLVKAFRSNLEEQQKLNNPYPQGSERYDDFQRGWYTGLVFGTVVSLVAPTKATKVIKQSKTASKVEDLIVTNGKLSKFGKAVRAVSKPGDMLKGRMTAHLAKRGSHVPNEMLEVADDAGGVAKVHRLGKQIDKSKLDSLDAGQREELGRLLLETGDDGATVVQKLDTATVKTILNEDSGKAAIRLDEMGVAASRTDELVANGIDLKRHKEGLEIYVRSGKSVSSNDGDIAEIIAHENVVTAVEKGQDIFDESKDYKVYPIGQGKGIKIYDQQGNNIGEFDHLVVNENDNVIAVYETKLPAGKATDADNQLTNLLNKIGSSNIDSSRTSYKLDDHQFTGTITKYTVGPRAGGGYDIKLDMTETELRAILKTVREEGI